MAKLGTKGRPAIVRVRTEARAKEVASLFAEHGWQFILGIEPDKPENIADLTRLLKTTRSGPQVASQKAMKTVPGRNKNAPLRVVQTRKKRTQSSAPKMKVTDERCEYFPDLGALTSHVVVSLSFSVLFLVLFVILTSLWCVVLLVLPFLYLLSMLYTIFLNQRIILHGNTITILRRIYKPFTGNMADCLYKVIMRNGTMFSFRFQNGLRFVQISPSVYKDGEQLRQHLTDIITRENIVVDTVEK
jgi:hypothetical protein